MQPLGSVDLESSAVTKRAARGHADLAEQAVGLLALAAARLVADGDQRAPLQPNAVEPCLVLPRGTPHSAESGVEGGGAAVTRVRAKRVLKACWNRATSGRFPECSMRLETSLPHERPAIRASM